MINETASRAIARVGLNDSTLVVVRQGEIVAMPVLRPGADPAGVCEQIESLQERLSAEGTPLAVGVSTIAEGVAELPRAYREARAARRVSRRPAGRGRDPAAVAVRVSGAGRRRDRAPRGRSSLRAFLAEDTAHGGVLSSTVQALARADLNLRAAAEQLRSPQHCPLPSAANRGASRSKSRRIADLLELLVAIELEHAEAPRSGALSARRTSCRTR